MFLKEYTAKQILATMNIPIPLGRIVQTPDETQQAAEEIGAVMVKAQVPTGKRGKGGGIKAAISGEAAREAAAEILNSTLNDYVVEQVLVEAQASIAHELYAAITHDPGRKCPLLIFSTAGGMEIETVYADTPEQVLMEPLSIQKGLDVAAARSLLPATTLVESHHEAVAEILSKLYELYRQYDAQLVEINPLAITTEGAVMALDCKLVIDDSALYRQPDLPPEKSRGTALEVAARQDNLLYIELDGDVAILANGAGLTMSTMDTVAAYGGQPANFMEVGGDAYKRAKSALSVVLGNSNIKSLLVNLCGAYARTDVIIEGVLNAWQALQPSIPVSFCIHGTGEERAKSLVQEQLGIAPYELMDDAVKAAVKNAHQERYQEKIITVSDTALPLRETQITAPPLEGIGGRPSPAAAALLNLLHNERRILVQGITGTEGAFWTEQMIAYGSNVVGGVTPGKGGQQVHGRAVYNTVAEARADQQANVSVLFVPPRFVKDAALDAIEAGIEHVVILTEHIPVQDVLTVLAVAGERGTQVIGPNSPGLVFPGRDFIGIMPGWAENMFQPGSIGVVSRSGSLGALTCLNIVQAGFGQSAFIGIGGDTIPGTTFRDVLEMFEHDSETDTVVMLGEIGGPMEEEAARYIPQMTKPVVAFIGGQSAPPDKKMGHAGAMISGNQGNAAAKMMVLREAGVHVAEVPSQIGKILVHLLAT